LADEEAARRYAKFLIQALVTQFGQAFVLTAFNYAQGENVGVELSAKYGT
jgi:hypothetical protein